MLRLWGATSIPAVRRTDPLRFHRVRRWARNMLRAKAVARATTTTATETGKESIANKLRTRLSTQTRRRELVHFFPPLCQMEASSHIPPTPAPTSPNNPSDGNLEILGPSTVMMMDEPIIREAVTMPIVSRLTARSI